MLRFECVSVSTAFFIFLVLIMLQHMLNIITASSINPQLSLWKHYSVFFTKELKSITGIRRESITFLKCWVEFCLGRENFQKHHIAYKIHNIQDVFEDPLRFRVGEGIAQGGRIIKNASFTANRIGLLNIKSRWQLLAAWI